MKLRDEAGDHYALALAFWHASPSVSASLPPPSALLSIVSVDNTLVVHNLDERSKVVERWRQTHPEGNHRGWWPCSLRALVMKLLRFQVSGAVRDDVLSRVHRNEPQDGAYRPTLEW
jgi:hypothetical protein